MQDGLLKLPYTMHDMVVLSFALSGTFLRILAMYRMKDVRNPSIQDWISIFLVSFMLTLGLYELAIFRNWDIEPLYLPFVLIVVLSKDIVDWFLMTKDGRNFVIKTIKSILTGAARKYLTYEEDNSTNVNNLDNDRVRDVEESDKEYSK